MLLSFLSVFCWCSFAGTLPPYGFPTHPRSGFGFWHRGLHGEGVEERSGDCGEDWLIGGGNRNGMVVLSFEELGGWTSWFQAVTHGRWRRPIVWTTLPSRAEPKCEAERTHHPAPELEELVRSDDLQFKLFIYKYSVFGSRPWRVGESEECSLSG